MSQFGSSAIAGLFLALFAQPLHASAVTQDAFGAAAKESFEGLSPGPNIPLLFGGVLKPGVNGPFIFPSGVTLTNPVPGSSNATGVRVEDWSIGSASFGLGENGSISSAADVPDGTAFLDLDASPGPIEFMFPADVNRVGALVSADSGSIILSVFSDSGALLQRVSVPAVHVSAWPGNFIGVESSIGIRRASFTNSNFLEGFNVLVLDDLIFETVPEPNYMRFLLVLASLGAWVSMRHPKL